MKSSALCVSAALLMATASFAPLAQAQPVSPAAAQASYQDQQARYQAAQSTYAAQSGDYAAERIAYERERDAYDAHYGIGAFNRYYAVRPGEYDARYGPGAYARDFGRPVAYEGPSPACEHRKKEHSVIGGLIGAVAGAALGSNIAVRGGRLGASIIGGLLGAGVGGAAGRGATHCD